MAEIKPLSEAFEKADRYEISRSPSNFLGATRAVSKVSCGVCLVKIFIVGFRQGTPSHRLSTLTLKGVSHFAVGEGSIDPGSSLHLLKQVVEGSCK